jgi:anthranilate synthase component 1
VPESEYQETVNKAMGMLKAVRMAEAIFETQQVQTTTNQDYYIHS